ncbi:MAG: hypothetical protein WAV54_10540 [Acidimicrobiales bacterium]|jgi:hypothetical protein
MTQSSEPPRPIETLVLVLADLLEEGADLFLEGLPTSLETSPGSAWATDRAVWKAAYESDDVAGWVSETSAIYLAESGHLLRAFATLLRSHRVFAAQDVIVRSVVERVGHVNWILDHRISSEQRAARVGLELAASFYTYREALYLLDANGGARADLRTKARAQQRQLKKWFDVAQPPEDECDDTSAPTGDVRRWVVGGEKFLSLTASAEFALEHGCIAKIAAQGTYAGLSGFSHPNVAFSREHRTIDEGGHITFRFDREAIEKAVRMALLSFADGVKHWVCYFDSDQVRAFERLDDIADRLDTACDTTPPS